MGLWNEFKINNVCTLDNKGISLIFEKGIEADLKKEYILLVKWLRTNYVFPVHINVYILNSEKVKLLSGTLAYGSFRWFPKRNPRIKIPSLINYKNFEDYTKGEIYDNVLSSLIHELTHYYQWIKNLEQTDYASERQADYYRYNILDKYYKHSKRNLRYDIYQDII